RPKDHRRLIVGPASCRDAMFVETVCVKVSRPVGTQCYVWVPNVMSCQSYVPGQDKHSVPTGRVSTFRDSATNIWSRWDRDRFSIIDCLFVICARRSSELRPKYHRRLIVGPASCRDAMFVETVCVKVSRPVG